MLCFSIFSFSIVSCVFASFNFRPSKKKKKKKAWLPGHFEVICRTRNRKLTLCGLMLHHAHISILQALRTGSYPAPCDKSHSEHLTPPSLSLSCAGRVWAENKLCYDVTLMACASFPSSHQLVNTGVHNITRDIDPANSQSSQIFRFCQTCINS